jgi:predicted DNA-binding transcriptional regulator YafY
MNRTDRLNAILTLLQSKNLVKGEEISERFGISLRTVYRDICALKEADIPIFSEAGYGYSLDSSFQIKPIRLTKDEASALCVGAAFTEKMTDSSMKKNIQTAIDKVRAILPDESKIFVEQLTEKMLFLTESSQKKPVENIIEILQKAIVSFRIVEINYFAKYKREYSRRLVEPLGLFHQFEEWHLIAFCRLRNDYRDFRLDRIHEIKATTEIFEPHHKFKLNEFLNNPENDKNLLEISALFSKKIAKSLREKSYFHILEEREEKHRIFYKFFAPNNDFMVNWFLSLGTTCEVLEPQTIRDRIKKKVVKIEKMYNKDY